MSLLDSLGVKSGRMVRTDNSIANEADGINGDGSQNVRVVGSATADVPLLSILLQLTLLLQAVLRLLV